MTTQLSQITSTLLSPCLSKPGHPWTRTEGGESLLFHPQECGLSNFLWLILSSQPIFFLNSVFQYLTCYTWDVKLSNILIWLKQKPWSQLNIWDWSGTTTASWGWQLFTQIKLGTGSVCHSLPLPSQGSGAAPKVLKIKNKMKLLSWVGVAFFSILDHW